MYYYYYYYQSLYVSTLCVPYIMTCDQVSQAFLSIFTYCNLSNTGSGEGLGMRHLSADDNCIFIIT